MTPDAPERMFLAAGTIAWLATFSPWVISSDQQDRLFERLGAYYRHPDYGTEGWWRVALLTTAGYQLNRTRLFGLQLDTGVGTMTLIANVDHHNSGLRDCIYQALSFTAPSIKWDSSTGEEMRRRVNSYLENRYLSLGWPIVIALSMKGERAAKLAWLAELPILGSSEKTLVRGLLREGTCDSPAADWMIKVTQHTAVALLDSDPVEQRASGEATADLFTQSVWNSVRTHPLTGRRFTIPDQ